MSTNWLAVRIYLDNTAAGRQVSECRLAVSPDFRLPSDCLGLHHGLDFVKVPRAKLVGINANIKGERQRLVRQVAVRVSVEVPRALGVVWPHSHRIMAKHNSLLCYVDFGQQIPG